LNKEAPLALSAPSLASTALRSLLLLSLATVGCGIHGHPGGGGPPVTGPQLQGSVNGGLQPVSGASIQLYAAGTTGYGTGAVPLLSKPVLSDASGDFTLTASTCPSSTSQLYLVATGGNPGLASSTNNASLSLMAAIGPCILSGTKYIPNPNTFVAVDEATTVASVYALAGFMNSAANQVGASATNAQGIANAFQTVSNLVDLTTGQPLAATPSGNGVAPQDTLNTLADILAACVNSTGTGGACTTLFTAATPSGGVAPTNTLQAAYDIATNPSAQVAALYALASATSPFQPTLASAPNDWTLAISYTGGGLSNAIGMAIDASGDIWFANNGTAPNTSSVTEFSNTGAILSGPTGYTGGGMNFAVAIAIDLAGNAWIPGYGNENVVELSSSGAVLSGANGYTLPATSFPQSVAIDAAGDAWVGSCGGVATPGVFKLSSTGTLLSPAQGFTAAQIVCPGRIAIDTAGDAWVVNGFQQNVIELSNSGTVLSGPNGFPSSIGLNNHPGAVAIDASGDAWVVDQFSEVLTKLSPAGVSLSGAAGFPSCTVGSENPSLLCEGGSATVAIDGAGDIWVGTEYLADSGTPPVTTSYAGLVELNNNGTILSGPTGYHTLPNNNPDAILPNTIAIDSSGNVWGVGGNVVLELVGAATPVVTPLSAGVKNNTLGTRP
jgi:hypothetical protein